MPSAETLDRFVARVEANAHVEAVQEFYTENSFLGRGRKSNGCRHFLDFGPRIEVGLGHRRQACAKARIQSLTRRDIDDASRPRPSPEGGDCGPAAQVRRYQIGFELSDEQRFVTPGDGSGCESPGDVNGCPKRAQIFVEGRDGPLVGEVPKRHQREPMVVAVGEAVSFLLLAIRHVA